MAEFVRHIGRPPQHTKAEQHPSQWKEGQQHHDVVRGRQNRGRRKPPKPGPDRMAPTAMSSPIRMTQVLSASRSIIIGGEATPARLVVKSLARCGKALRPFYIAPVTDATSYC